MTFDEHNLRVGRIVGNLQSLELVLRLFLSEDMAEEVRIPQPGDDTVPETRLTSYESLGDLVRAYNAKLMNVEEPKFAVDSTVVTLRDALAHGRVVSLRPSPPLTLYKLAKPKKGIVRIESVDVMTIAWLSAKITLSYGQITKVAECAKARGHKWLG